MTRAGNDEDENVIDPLAQSRPGRQARDSARQASLTFSRVSSPTLARKFPLRPFRSAASCEESQ